MPPSPQVRENLRVRSGTTLGLKCSSRLRKYFRWPFCSSAGLWAPGKIDKRMRSMIFMVTASLMLQVFFKEAGLVERFLSEHF
jgi:hypothetical protein